jgi:twitching motility protein PilT
MASEIMLVNQGIASSIRSRRLSQLGNLIQIGGIDGMHTIDDSLMHLASYGFITLDDAMIRARDPEFVKIGFQKFLQERSGKKR